MEVWEEKPVPYKWTKRFIFSSIPVLLFSLWIGYFPAFIAFFYYLNLWIVAFSYDEYGGKRFRGGNQNSSDLFGGEF
jgi:hypothetical protein